MRQPQPLKAPLALIQWGLKRFCSPRTGSDGVNFFHGIIDERLQRIPEYRVSAFSHKV